MALRQLLQNGGDSPSGTSRSGASCTPSQRGTQASWPQVQWRGGGARSGIPGSQGALPSVFLSRPLKEIAVIYKVPLESIQPTVEGKERQAMFGACSFLFLRMLGVGGV